MCVYIYIYLFFWGGGGGAGDEAFVRDPKDKEQPLKLKPEALKTSQDPLSPKP